LSSSNFARSLFFRAASERTLYLIWSIIFTSPSALAPPLTGADHNQEEDSFNGAVGQDEKEGDRSPAAAAVLLVPSSSDADESAVVATTVLVATSSVSIRVFFFTFDDPSLLLGDVRDDETRGLAPSVELVTLRLLSPSQAVSL
jgi:hypothetical protein